MSVVVLDPSIGSNNLGDYIIVDSALRELRSVFPGEFFVRFPTQERPGPVARRTLIQSRLGVVAGTNLLTSHVWRYRQWQVGLREVPAMKHVRLMGVGWWQYQKRPDALTAAFYRALLSGGDRLHAIRDRYTVEMLRAAGVENAIFTGCPSMWSLTEEHCKGIPTEKADAVVCTVTDYNRNVATDRAMMELLLDKYRQVYFWPQGAEDSTYIRQLGTSCHVMSPDLEVFLELLRGPEAIDYIGTRLHGGIQALRCGRRSLILAIDNRAEEIGRDTGLTVRERGDIPAIERWISGQAITRIELPTQAIERWKASLLQAMA